MCVAMVIIQTKSLEKKGVDDVTSKESHLELCKPATMSQGAALFSFGIMAAETSRWRDVGQSCGIQQHPVGSSLENLWDSVPESCQGPTAGTVWGPPSTISSLLQNLSLSESGTSLSTAPPSKRQCRSLSCSDDLTSGCRSPWRPQGSRVWTAVEKRRCHSGGSVAQRGGAAATMTHSHMGFPGMQRSSSFSLPARSNTLELPCFSSQQRLPFTGLLTSPCSSEPPRNLYFSHEQICHPEPQGPSDASSSPDSTPELGRRSGQGGLSRSRSQPCVLNDKKIGIKRRRPADTRKQRPSLDLAKMTQKQRNFQSLSCPGISGDDCCQLGPSPTLFTSTHQCKTDFVCACSKGKEHRRTSTEDQRLGEDLSIEEQDRFGDLISGTTNGKDQEPLWEGLCESRRELCLLGGELDIEQIERN